MKSVRLVTLGCAKNEVDSEEIAGVLLAAGYTFDPVSDRVDAVIINTCGFLDAAKKEGVEVIRQSVAAKRSGHVGKVVVAGCLSQRLGEEMLRVAPGADAYVGVGQMASFGSILDATFAGEQPTIQETPPQHLWADVPTRMRSGTPWSAYLKLSEGCDHKCTFCTIPSFRGSHQSKPIERLVQEARHLARTGARELNLIAQDVTQYGYDLYKSFTLPKLLRELNQIEEIDWIRLLYFYPNRLTNEVIEAVASLPRVLPYVDIPLQHAHPEVLRSMKRPWSGDRYLKLFEKLRSRMPECAIRTTFIVGFPGETDEQFRYLLEFVESAKLDRVGAFTFSREPGTPAYSMPNQVSARVKRERYDALMSLQQGISLEKNRNWVGKRLDVLVENEAENQFAGRSFRDAPEIDGLVYLDGREELGQLIEVEITGASEYDLFAKRTGRKREHVRRVKQLKVSAG